MKKLVHRSLLNWTITPFSLKRGANKRGRVEQKLYSGRRGDVSDMSFAVNHSRRLARSVAFSAATIPSQQKLRVKNNFSPADNRTRGPTDRHRAPCVSLVSVCPLKGIVCASATARSLSPLHRCTVAHCCNQTLLSLQLAPLLHYAPLGRGTLWHQQFLSSLYLSFLFFF